ncbi:MAG: SIS domain-containing protein [Candidatus Lokiarchaeota archaeon]|nr:SIS domain-containing protein [Candidatus Lokiarchaeota archaeon]MBD3199895.1 SIS domain-containing protein [Candidatus Lokiarchaeota archaeon]
MNNKKNEIEIRIKDTMREISDKILFNTENLDYQKIQNFLNLILEMFTSGKRIFVYGAGRSGLIGSCFAQRLMHLGINSCFVSDAVTYRYTSDDLLLIISGSGETTSPVAIAEKAKKIGGKIVLLTGNPKSTIGKLADIIIKIEGKSKEKAIAQKTLAPYTSLFDISALALLDSIGGTLMNILSITERDIDNRHASIE